MSYLDAPLPAECADFAIANRSDIPPVDLSMPIGDAGAPAKPALPLGDARIAARPGSPVPAYERVVAGLRPRVRTCYRKWLATDAKAAGALHLDVVVLPNGDVDAANVAPAPQVDRSASACVARVFKNAQFDPPAADGGSAHVHIDVTFVPP